MEIINLEHLEVAPPTMKRVRTEISTTPGKNIRIGVEKSLHGSRLQTFSRQNIAKLPETVDVVKEKTEKALKLLKTRHGARKHNSGHLYNPALTTD